MDYKPKVLRLDLYLIKFNTVKKNI